MTQCPHCGAITAGSILNWMRERFDAALIASFPECADPEKLLEVKGRLARYLVAQGMHEDEVRSTIDSRLLLFAEKARRWDKYHRSMGRSSYDNS